VSTAPEKVIAIPHEPEAPMQIDFDPRPLSNEELALARERFRICLDRVEAEQYVRVARREIGTTYAELDQSLRQASDPETERAFRALTADGSDEIGVDGLRVPTLAVVEAIAAAMVFEDEFPEATVAQVVTSVALNEWGLDRDAAVRAVARGLADARKRTSRVA
jgi:hypothetical protein